MPKKGQKDKDAESAAVVEKGVQPPTKSVKETTLAKELEGLTSELEALKKQVNELRTENQWLQEEAERTKAESQDYQTFISRKSQKRQTLIVSLTDQNRLELQEIQKQKEELLKVYEERKGELTSVLLEKENELSRLNTELRGLEQYKALRSAQEQEISQLERVVEDKKFDHENKVRILKAKFLEEKRLFEVAMEDHIRTMADQANMQAAKCLKDQTERIRRENHELRHQLVSLIQTTDELQLQKRKLEKQYKKG
ncbi:hypothetical protein EMCRGX_G028013 [Ephydatia muelleri]